VPDTPASPEDVRTEDKSLRFPENPSKHRGGRSAKYPVKGGKVLSDNQKDHIKDNEAHLVESESESEKDQALSSDNSDGKDGSLLSEQRRLSQRQKQIDLGKQTLGYDCYIQAVPRRRREKGNQRHPRTPNIHTIRSKRSWDGIVRKWRRQLHLWDPISQEPNTENFTDDGFECSYIEQVLQGEQSGKVSDSVPSHLVIDNAVAQPLFDPVS